MKSIKSLDFFQKISVENVSRPTLLGAIISLSAIFLMFYLLIMELINFRTPIIKKDAIIFQDSKGERQIRANLSIKLFNVPCPIVSIDQEDLIGAHKMDIKENLTKNRLDSENNKIIGSYVPYKTDLLAKSIKEKESCHIKGFVQINKAPGDIHLSFHNFREVWEYLKSNKSEFFKSVKLNHKLLSLSFGEKDISDYIESNYGINEMTKNLITKPNLPSFDKEFNDEKFYNFDYYIKLIPHLIKDEINAEEFVSYQYSLSSKSKTIDGDEEMPIIMINYDMSDITMKITIQKRSLSKFLIHVCAIVGGVFVMFSIINGLLLSLCEGLFESDKSNKFDN